MKYCPRDLNCHPERRAVGKPLAADGSRGIRYPASCIPLAQEISPLIFIRVEMTRYR